METNNGGSINVNKDLVEIFKSMSEETKSEFIALIIIEINKLSNLNTQFINKCN